MDVDALEKCNGTTMISRDREPETSRPGLLLSSSGSAGAPKLILRRDTSFFHRLHWTWTTLPLRAGEVALQKSHMTTTHHVYETMEALLKGVPVHILPDLAVFGVHNFLPYVQKHGVTRLLLVPTLLRAVLTNVPAGRRTGA